MKRSIFAVTVTAGALVAGGATAFPPSATSEKPCTECHRLSVEEAQNVLGNMVERVLAVDDSEVPGLWVVDIERGQKRGPIYLDYGKRYLFSGTLLDLATRTDLTKERYVDLNRVDVSAIPLDDAVVIGDRGASTRVVVFDDPECPYCRKLHPEMKKVAEQRPEVAFFIKMLPLKIHPDARRKAEAIVCANSGELLEDSLAGRPVPDPTCETDQIEKNESLAAELGIRSTPTLVFPDGRVMPGYKSAMQILAELRDDEKADRAAAQ